MSEGAGRRTGERPVGHRRIRRLLRARPGEGGFSLIEIIVTIVILGLAMTSVVSSMSASQTLSDKTALLAAVEGEARKLGEVVRSRATPFPVCGTHPTLEEAYKEIVEAEESGLPEFEFDVVKVEWGVLNSVTSPVPNFEPSNCDGAPATVHRITIEARSTEEPSIKATVTVVKRDPTDYRS